jgi:Protein of unknown function (DUF2934)
MARKPSRTESMPSEIKLPPALSPEELHQLVAEAAYYRAEQRGFAPGQDVEDWLAAEAQLMSRPDSTEAS